MSSIYNFELKNIDGQTVSLNDYRGQVVMFVNVASACGFTPQYKELEQLYQKFKSQGFTILAFPCNQFGNQEQGSDSEIKQFCSMEYRITFPVFSKIDVNGPKAHPLYNFLKHEKRGVLGTSAIKWNFTKFLIDRAGNVVDRYAPSKTPDSLAPRVKALLED